MQALAKAQANIALIKYWGKADIERNLPAVGSLSITLDSLWTTMAVDFSSGLDQDSLTLNGEPNTAALPRISACLDGVAGVSRVRASVVSESNFPIAAGLASSASAFAALVVAAGYASGADMATLPLARIAGAASGSAARSLYGGFVELQIARREVHLKSLMAPADWPLRVVVAVTETGPKAVSSTAAMQRSAQTSPFYARWIEQQDADLSVARSAVLERDFEKLAEVSEHNCLKMHSLTWTSRPPIVYWNNATFACMQAVRDLRANGEAVFFTIDAGPQVKAVCLPESEDKVAASLASIDGVCRIMRAGLGEGARLLTDSGPSRESV